MVVPIGKKTIRGVLERNNLVKSHRKKRIQKKQEFYAPYPEYRVQIDTKVVPDLVEDKRSPLRYQFTAIDIASKIRFLLIYKDLSTYNSINFLKKALAFYKEIGIHVECVQTDNHSTFTNLYIGRSKKRDHESLRIHPFTEYCLAHNIEHLLSPQDNAFVERSHCTDNQEFYSFLSLPLISYEKLQLLLREWMFTYKFLRIHSSCHNLPPFKFFLQNVWTTGAL
jgi:hypothetical protein